MTAKFLTVLLAVAVLAVPAAGTASQPADVRVTDFRPATPVAAAPIGELALLTRKTQKLEGFDFVVPTGVIAHDWVSNDPFKI